MLREDIEYRLGKYAFITMVSITLSTIPLGIAQSYGVKVDAHTMLQTISSTGQEILQRTCDPARRIGLHLNCGPMASIGTGPG